MGSMVSLFTYYDDLYEWDSKQIHRKYLLTKQIEQSKTIKLRQLKRIKFIF